MQKEKPQKLIKVSTYATQNNKSTTWVYNQIKSGKLEMIVIDGIKFIKIN